MKVVIIGGVAAGPKLAARLERLSEKAEITIIEKGEFLSYAGCGLPYYISGVVKEQKELMATPIGVVRDSVFFQNVKNIKVLNYTEATDINTKEKTVKTMNKQGQEQMISYDKLIFATGAEAICPALPGRELENIFTLKTVSDAEKIKNKLAEQKATDTVIVGGGLIGVEVAESFVEMGCRVTIVELMPNILSMMDPEMSQLVEKYFESKGVKILTKTKVTGYEGNGCVQKVMTDQGELQASLVVTAIGVRPNIRLAEKIGLKLGPTSAIAVDAGMKTSEDDIYAVGDCAEKTNLITKKPCYVPLGSTANKEGRVAANTICGIKDDFPGVLGSAVCKVFDYTVGRTGLSETEAIAQGFDVVTCLFPAPDKAHFLPTAKPLFLKLVADRKTRKLLGLQATGPGVSDKRVDIAATALTFGATVDQIANVDLSYAPPYAPAMDNIITAANIIRNKIDGLMEGIMPVEVYEMKKQGVDFTFLDVRSQGEVDERSIEGTTHIPLGALRKRVSELDNTKPVIAFCKMSLRGYEAALILKKAGFSDVKVMDGGILMWFYQ